MRCVCEQQPVEIKADASARYSCLPGLYYYAEHGYTRDPEVDVTLLKLKFGMYSRLSSYFVHYELQMALSVVALIRSSTPRRWSVFIVLAR